MVAETTLPCLCGGLDQLHYHTILTLGCRTQKGWVTLVAVPVAVARPPRGGYSGKNWVFSDAPRPVDRTGAWGGVTDMP